MVNFHHICRLCGHSRPQASPTHGYRALIQHSSQQNRSNNRHIWPKTNICCAFLYISTTNTCGLVRRSIHIWLVTYRAPPYLPNLIDNLPISDSLRLLNLNVIFFFFQAGHLHICRIWLESKSEGTTALNLWLYLSLWWWTGKVVN